MRLFNILLVLFSVFFLTPVYSDELPNPDENNLANFHLKDETCSGQCHEDESPSDSLEFEENSCVECHDNFGLLEGRQHNIKHLESENMTCIECHFPHESFDAREICTDCHDEGDKELEGFYSGHNRAHSVFKLVRLFHPDKWYASINVGSH